MFQAEQMYRKCWRKVSKEMNVETNRVDLDIPQNKMIKTYYDVCAGIECHNRQRQDDMEIERIVKTLTWSKRVCIPVFGMIVVDNENVYIEVVHQSELDKSPYDFFTKLAHEMIFNDIYRPSSRRRQGPDINYLGSPGTGISPKNCVSLTTSNNKGENSDKHTFAGSCKIKGFRMKLT